MVKYFKGPNLLIGDLEGEVNAESDCEGDLPEVGEVSNEGNEERIRAVLTKGSFSAYAPSILHLCIKRVDMSASWRSLFFYRCTDEISFAPLKSQGLDTRMQYIREHTVAAAPPPCSPKSIYILASLVRREPNQTSHIKLTCRLKLDLQPLRNSAFADIKSKLSVENVVNEVFSSVNAT